ncbi:MAG TPA: hypothetical protein VFA59_18225 [Vicinamibacterales bacterium]|nr:hypothetical protein [Vicinamibacterales bacterium]
MADIDYEAVIADLEARKATIDNVIAGIRAVLAAGVPGTSPSGGGPSGGGIKPDTFLKMSIPDATKKLLEITRSKQSTQDVMDQLVKGGLPPSKYNTVYSILSRRASQVGDIINMKGDWALAEWYPNHRPKAKKGGDSVENTKKDEKATA